MFWFLANSAILRDFLGSLESSIIGASTVKFISSDNNKSQRVTQNGIKTIKSIWYDYGRMEKDGKERI